MSTYKWSVPVGKEINGQTYIKDTDNKIYDTISDLVDFVNSEGAHTGAGLVYDLVDKTSAQTITGNKIFTNATITGSLSGNASTATTLANSRNISLTGDITGSASFNGGSDISITAVVVDDSHNHSNLIPSGCIVMWSGSVDNIPSGWFLCNGNNGTPNLINKFIIGAGGLYSVSSTGGSSDSVVPSHTHTLSSATISASGSHTHTAVVQGGSYSHTVSNTGDQPIYTIVSQTSASGSHTHTVSGTTDSSGVSGTDANLPPYYALCYIMKG